MTRAGQRGESCWAGRRVRSGRALKHVHKTLDFILSAVGSHQKVLSRGMAQCDTFLNYIFQFLWLVYRTTINFCLLTTYPVILLDSLPSFGSICIDYLELGLLQTRSFHFFLSVQTSCLLFLLAAFLNNSVLFNFLAVLGLHCCEWAFSGGTRGPLSMAVHGLLTEAASLAAKHGL